MFTEDTLAWWLETAGTSADESAPTIRHHVEQLFLYALGRRPDRSAIDPLVKEVEQGTEISEIRSRLYGSIERFSQPGRVGYGSSESYRRLATLGDEHGRAVAPELIAECIAAYHVVLGRDPDGAGYHQFIRRRSENAVPLVSVIADICGSPESTDYHAPHPAPSAGEAAIATTIMTTQITQALVLDIMASRLEKVEGLIKSVDRNLEFLRHSLELHLKVRPR